MDIYFVRPIRHDTHAEAWSHTIKKAKELRSQLQDITGLKWIITKEGINYGSSV